MNTTKKGSCLEGFKLYYEELEKKVAKPKTSKVLTNTKKIEVKKNTVALKERFNNIINKLRGLLHNVVKLNFLHRKNTKKPNKAAKQLARQQQLRGILGIGLLFVVVSIAYSSYVIFNGVSSTASRVMLVPQVVFAGFTLIKAFSKIYK